MDKFRDETGRLTPYAFACGYIEQKTTNKEYFRESDLYTELYQDGCFHVRQYDRRPGAEVFRVFWESFETLKEAVKLFDSQKGELYNGRKSRSRSRSRNP